MTTAKNTTGNAETSHATLEQAVIAAAREAGTLIRAYAFGPYELAMKKEDDPVTSLDKMAERRIRELLARSAPGNFVGEEYGTVALGLPITYHIDPIDGTKSFVLHDFTSAVSIGVEENDKLIGGVVHDFMRDITYAGFNGDCYILHDGKKHPMRDKHPFSKIRLSIDRDAQQPQYPMHYAIHERKGSIALAMAELAAGNYDGMISTSIGKGNSWDVAAGYYLLKARGFNVQDIEHNPFNYKDGSNGIVAIRPDIATMVYDELPSYSTTPAASKQPRL